MYYKKTSYLHFKKDYVGVSSSDQFNIDDCIPFIEYNKQTIPMKKNDYDVLLFDFDNNDVYNGFDMKYNKDEPVIEKPPIILDPTNIDISDLIIEI